MLISIPDTPWPAATMLCAVLAGTIVLCAALALPALALDYLATPRDDVVDDYFGTLVPDPYRWLEDITSPGAQNWVAAQNQLTFGYLDGIPGRQGIYDRLTEVVNYERVSLPSHTGNRYFFTRNDGLQNQSVMFWSEGLGGEPRVLLDPNSWSEDGTVALAGTDVTLDGQWLLYGVSTHGSDWVEMHVLNIDSGEELTDRIRWAKGVGHWDRDGAGFYYTRFPVPEPGTELTASSQNPMVYYHKLGTGQDEDRLVFSLPEHPEWYLGAGLNEERDLLLYWVGQPGTDNNRLYFQDALTPDAPIEHILDGLDAQYGFVTNSGRKLLIQTTRDAPNWRVVEIDMDNPGRDNWREVLPEREMALGGLDTAGGYLFATYLKDAHSVVYQYTLDGGFVREIRFPGPVTAHGFGGWRDDTEVFYSYAGFTTPGKQFRLDLATGESTFHRENDIPMDLSGFEARQYFYRAPDGTAIPMFVISRKGIVLDGSNPTILYGYGGFANPQVPYFSTGLGVWLELGGVYAIACIRGGGEYGEAWHEAATKASKPVSYDDFNSGAEWLIEQGYCTPRTLACCGWSNGGLMIGAVINQRPELYRVALPGTGVMDLLRFNLWGWGAAWESEWGSPQNPDEFPWLYAISPYHNIREDVVYPSTLIMTADTDDRVMPAHSFKYAAALQRAQGPDGPPVLLRVEVRAGHGGDVPLDKYLWWTADQYAFTLHEMGYAIPEL